ncbi:hypothetical protein BSV1_X37 (plasmid) [Borreliella finlandensis]|uniref:Uncharacterized protein n=1 Tax=Borreliella finlandensis TaxID=498741 RepID=A0A806CMN4_9SPIR|nr:hypothetical protein BSV1_X37 [Borreliella finlandensis]
MFIQYLVAIIKLNITNKKGEGNKDYQYIILFIFYSAKQL